MVTGLVGGPGPVPWRNASIGVGLGMSGQESYSSGFCSVPSAVGLATPPTGMWQFSEERNSNRKDLIIVS